MEEVWILHGMSRLKGNRLNFFFFFFFSIDSENDKFMKLNEASADSNQG